MFVGLRVQYGFYNIFNLLGDLGESDEEDESLSDILSEINGVVGIDNNTSTSSCMIFPKSPIQAIFSVGFVW